MHLVIEPGARLRDSSGTIVIVLQILNGTEVIVRDFVQGNYRVVPISELDHVTPPTLNVPVDGVDEDDLNLIHAQYLSLEPFLSQKRMDGKALAALAVQEGVSVSTIRRRIARLAANKVLTSLTRKPRKDRGHKRFDIEVEKIIQKIIKTRYLNKQQRSVIRCHRELKIACDAAKLPVPSYGAFRSRILKLNPYEADKARLGDNKALSKREVRGSVPGANYPYALLQIDHTQVDVILVDDLHRLPLDKPWITVAIDVYSRMIAGLYIAFESPGMLGTGLCITNAMLPKDQLLRRLGLDDVSYPCFGKPTIIMADNAKEFRGKDLAAAGKQHHIDIRLRRIKKPQYGAHIERLMGTLAKEIHALPGTTFGDINRREAYDSEAQSAMTLSEFEKWLGNLCYRTYHNRKHGSLDKSPLQQYLAGLVGSENQVGSGRVTLLTDPDQLRIDFLPGIWRTIQPDGVGIDKIQYYGDELRRWIGAKQPNDITKARKFLFKRDPRDISTIQFYDPSLKRYVKIPYRDASRPPMTLWELRAVNRWLKAQGLEAQDEEQVFRGYAEMLRIENAAVKQTKAARVAQGKRRAVKERLQSEGVERKKSSGKKTIGDSGSPIDPATEELLDDALESVLAFDTGTGIPS